VKETVDQLGGLDIIVANAGWTRFSDFADLNALPLEDWNKVNWQGGSCRSYVVVETDDIVLGCERHEPPATTTGCEPHFRQ